MHPQRATFVRTLLTAGLILALLASPTASAQEEAVEEPAGEAAVVVEDVAYPILEEPIVVVEEPAVIEVAFDQPVTVEAPVPTPMPVLTQTPAPSPTAAPAAAATKVAAAVIDNRFQPNALNIAVGSTVTWTNNGNNIHTLTSAEGLFDSGGLLGGQSFSFTFQKAGTYRLICRQHGLNGMAGSVIVQ
jgi:plastocyanin